MYAKLLAYMPEFTEISTLSQDYELVRIHHPDSIHGRSISPRLRHARFQCITAAYDALRGKRAHANVDPYTEEILRRKRAYYAHYGHRPRAEHAYYGGRHNWHASVDDRWKDRIILAVGITVCTFLYSLAIGGCESASAGPCRGDCPRLIYVPCEHGEKTSSCRCRSCSGAE